MNRIVNLINKKREKAQIYKINDKEEIIVEAKEVKNQQETTFQNFMQIILKNLDV